MNTSDVQVYDYVTDDGHRIAVSLATFGEVDKRRKVDVSITVDGVERLHTGTHYSCPAGVPLGEWMVYGVLNCLCTHMEQFGTFQLLNNLFSMANADEVKFIPIDDRHISELTDAQAEWWNEGDNHTIVDYIYDKVRPIAKQAIEQYPQLQNKENN
jgi:hypothetical protein